MGSFCGKSDLGHSSSQKNKASNWSLYINNLNRYEVLKPLGFVFFYFYSMKIKNKSIANFFHII